ncbi:MAG: alpha/beta hydrolase fold protein [Frankiales bacterium]|nr:alpha/beta hydrolase fold protein [Frankiales bacterium]
MPTTLSDGVRISWQETGSGTPLLLCMGASYSSAMWYPAVSALATSHRVISFDNRGTGGSGWTSVASIEDMASDALAVLDAAGERSAHVYGASLGGVVAQQIALQAPDRVRSLVLGCTGILSEDKPRAPRWLRHLLRLPRPVLSALLSKSDPYGPACPADRAAVDRAVLAEEKPARQALVAQQDALRAYRVTREQVAALDVPALVLHGDADTVVKHAWGEELAATLPQARLVSYPGIGHNYLVGRGDEANAEVLAFLRSVDAVAPELQPAP